MAMVMVMGESPKVDVMAQLQQQYQSLLQVTQLLVQAGADLNLKNRRRKTAFDIASEAPESLYENDIHHFRPIKTDPAVQKN